MKLGINSCVKCNYQCRRHSGSQRDTSQIATVQGDQTSCQACLQEASKKYQTLCTGPWKGWGRGEMGETALREIGGPFYSHRLKPVLPKEQMGYEVSVAQTLVCAEFEALPLTTSTTIL